MYTDTDGDDPGMMAKEMNTKYYSMKMFDVDYFRCVLYYLMPQLNINLKKTADATPEWKIDANDSRV